MATDLDTEETEEQQEKCQRVRKWKAELQILKDYHKSCTIFLHNLLEQGGCSHMGYLESHISEPGAGFFIKSFKTWWLELEKQSQGIGHSAMSAHCKLKMLEQMYGVKLSSHIPTDWIIRSHGTVLHYAYHYHTIQGDDKGWEEEIDVQVLLLALRLCGAESPFSQQSLSCALASVPALYY